MNARTPLLDIAALWAKARSGDLRGAWQGAQQALERAGGRLAPRSRVELHLVGAAAAMRQGHHADALRELACAERAAALLPRREARLALRIDVWRAELAYFQGRYSAVDEIVARVAGPLERCGDLAYLAFAMRVRIAVLLARASYDAIGKLAERALHAAERCGDDYVLVQVLNILGAVSFDRATSKLAQPHARAHLTALDPGDVAPMERDAREALALFERARAVAQCARLTYAAWYVAGNIERLHIVLGRPELAVRAIRKRLAILQKRGATYDEIVARSNLGWALRNLGRHREALLELDAALAQARTTGTCNVLLEFLHYDRSVVLAAIGDAAAAQSSYRRYLRFMASRPARRSQSGKAPAASPRPALEPYFLKRADRFVAERLHEPITIGMIARHCGVSERTLEKAFTQFRGLTPVAHVRNLRLDGAHATLGTQGGGIADVAARYGFASPTTFALEYRKRFGAPPSRSRPAKA